MKALLFVMLFSISFNSFAKQQCSKTNKEVCAQVEFVKSISRKSDSSFLLKFSRDGKNFLPKIKPAVKLWMVMDNGHAHGSDPVKLESKDSSYVVSNVWFLMRGTWFIKIKTDPKAKEFDISIPVCVARTAEDSMLGECK